MQKNLRIMKENKINNFHFCCNCKGFMINKKKVIDNS